ncbi:MAG: ATP-binding cassette domain-containing protein [Planctomycetes bacterium]|nr:ATP-binding cassette domain-containing protein [Planctomycetota bacterium]
MSHAPLALRAEGVVPIGRAAAGARPLDLAVAAGSLHALVGGNGTGKSSFLRAVCGELPFRGTIERCEQFGVVPQHFAPDPTLALTVGEFLALSRQRRPLLFGRGASRARVVRALALVDLAALEERPLAELSGGELRRLLLAHACEPEPPLLLLDEPTEGLDAAARERCAELLQAARARGAGVLLVSHDRELVARVADAVTELAPAGAA